MNKTVLGGIAVILALVFSTVAIFKQSPAPQVKAVYGGTSPEIQSPYVDFGGVRHWYASTNTLNQASTTLCSFLAPNATTTLVFASITLTTGTTTAIDMDIGKSLSPSATTTVFNDGLFSSGILGTMMASTTALGATVIDPVFTFAAPYATSTTATGVPQQGYYHQTYLNFIYGGPLGSLNVFTGSCKAEWIQNL